MNGKYLRMQSRGYQMRGQTGYVFQLLGGGKDRKHKGIMNVYVEYRRLVRATNQDMKSFSLTVTFIMRSKVA